MVCSQLLSQFSLFAAFDNQYIAKNDVHKRCVIKLLALLSFVTIFTAQPANYLIIVLHFYFLINFKCKCFHTGKLVIGFGTSCTMGLCNIGIDIDLYTK